MDNEFNIADLHRILANCPEYAEGHHLDRPFMSAYQIAIRFAEDYPDHPRVRSFPVGGTGTGSRQSLTKQIAKFLSQAILNGNAPGIEGGFISHECIADFNFEHQNNRIQVSTLQSETAHSIFRARRTADMAS